VGFNPRLNSNRRDAAEEDMKSTWKSDFAYFPCVENKLYLAITFQSQKWKMSSADKTLKDQRQSVSSASSAFYESVS
jgi:hypothetical protein